MFRPNEIDSLPSLFNYIKVVRDVCIFLCCVIEKGAYIVDNCNVATQFIHCFECVPHGVQSVALFNMLSLGAIEVCTDNGAL